MSLRGNLSPVLIVITLIRSLPPWPAHAIRPQYVVEHAYLSVICHHRQLHHRRQPPAPACDFRLNDLHVDLPPLSPSESGRPVEELLCCRGTLICEPDTASLGMEAACDHLVYMDQRLAAAPSRTALLRIQRAIYARPSDREPHQTLHPVRIELASLPAPHHDARHRVPVLLTWWKRADLPVLC